MMRALSRLLAAGLVMLGCSHVAGAQTADDVVNKCVTAMGGRAALEKLKSRSIVGTITLSTPAAVKLPGAVLSTREPRQWPGTGR